MLKRVRLQLTAVSLLVMLIAGLCIFYIAGASCKNDIRLLALDKLSALQAAEYDGGENSFEETLDRQYIEKADAVSYMIKLDPTLLIDNLRLKETAKMLGFDEIHITDENGVLWWGTVEGYYGFDFSQANQSLPMLDILKDSSLKIAQEPQQNGFGVVYKYIGVARSDAKGIVMAGIDPKNLIAAPENADAAAIDKTFGKNGFVFTIDAVDKKVLDYPADTAVNGRDAADIGITDNAAADGFEGKLDILGSSFYCIASQSGDKLFYAAVPMDELYDGRNEVMVISTAMGLLVFFACQLMAGLAIKHNVIKKIRAFADEAEKAQTQEVLFDERSCAEYAVLSDKLNTAFSQLKKQNGDMQRRLEEQRSSSSDEMSDLSHKMMAYAAEQTQITDEIGDELAGILEKSSESSRKAAEALAAAQKCEKLALDGGSRMSGILGSLGEINRFSEQIGEMAARVGEIASRTSKFALNAAIEASRAGENGKRFAAIAEEVRTLAIQSADATSSIAALNKSVGYSAKLGGDAARNITGDFGKLEENSKLCAETVKSISDIAKRQAEIIRDSGGSLDRMIGSINQSGAAAAAADKADEKPLEQEKMIEKADAAIGSADITETEIIAAAESEISESVAAEFAADEAADNEAVTEHAADVAEENTDNEPEVLPQQTKTETAEEHPPISLNEEKAETVPFDDRILIQKDIAKKEIDAIEQAVADMLDELTAARK